MANHKDSALADHIDSKCADMLSHFDEVICELSKDKPRSDRVKKFMQSMGLVYHGDQIRDLQVLLHALYEFEKKSGVENEQGL